MTCTRLWAAALTVSTGCVGEVAVPSSPQSSSGTPEVVTDEVVADDVLIEPSTDEPQGASEPQHAMLILDASGSMWGEVDGRAKIEIAREVVNQTVEAWDDQSHLGLMAYGHNRKGDCDDIEVLVAPGPVNAESMSTKTQGLYPKGMTPLTEAVKRAAEQLRYAEQKATVILVSDGRETCNLDPCEVGAELEKAGVDFTAHIISFDVAEEHARGMKCLADETGGLFVEVKNAGELKEAMADAARIVTETAALDLGPATLTVPASVPAGSSFEVGWTGPKNAGDYVTLASPSAPGEGFDRTYLASIDFVSPAPLTAPEATGPYVVQYRASNHRVLGEAPTKVVPVTATLDAPSSVVAGTSFDVAWTGPHNRYDRLSIYAVGEDNPSRSAFAYKEGASPTAMYAPAEEGPYELRFETNGGVVLATHALTVTPAEATVMVDQLEIVAGNLITVRWRGPTSKGDRIVLLDAQGAPYAAPPGYKPYSHTQQVHTLKGKDATITVPEVPGSYRVGYRSGEGERILASWPIIVFPAIGAVSIDGPVQGKAFFIVQWSGPGNASDRLTIRDLTRSDASFHGNAANVQSDSPAKLIAPEQPGQYRVDLVTGTKGIIASGIFEVR